MIQILRLVLHVQPIELYELILVGWCVGILSLIDFMKNAQWRLVTIVSLCTSNYNYKLRVCVGVGAKPLQCTKH